MASLSPPAYGPQPYPCSGKHIQRLLVGEGSFTYTEALVRKQLPKHPNFGRSIVATELRADLLCDTCTTKKAADCEDCRATAARIHWLQSQGVTIYTQVNAEKLHMTSPLSSKKWPRIHWNVPHDGSSRPSETMPKIIQNFFKSCSRVQDNGGRVYLSIKQPPGKNAWFQVGVHELIQAACTHSYILDTKRTLNSHRYPGYRHTQTARRMPDDDVERYAREFVFKKISLDQRQSLHKEGGDIDEATYLVRAEQYSKKGYRVGAHHISGKSRAFFDCKTDPESTDYSEPESQAAAAGGVDELAQSLEKLSTK